MSKSSRSPASKGPASRSGRGSSRTVLVATTGLSPAVLTETVWALAQEKKPIIPDQIIVLTTVTGQKRLAEQLFGADELWADLRRDILGPRADTDQRLDFDLTPDRVKVVHLRVGTRRQPLDELLNSAQHTAFADALVDELWVHTSKPDTRVVASLAGGFKTMSALLLSGMQLLANPGDRVTHVLVGGGYEATKPSFYFPRQKAQTLKQIHSGATLIAKDAAPLIQLIDVPVIPLRRWFAEALDRKPPSYETLVNCSIAAVEAHVGDLTLELGPVVLPSEKHRHWMKLNGTEHPLSPARYVYLRVFAERVLSDTPPGDSLADLFEEIQDWLRKNREVEPRFSAMFESHTRTQPTSLKADDLPKRLKDLRTHLESLPGGRSLASALPAKGHWALRLEKSRIKLQ